MISQSTPTIALIIPTYQAENDIPYLMPAVMAQSLQPHTILIIDSSSSDKTIDLLSPYPVQIHRIAKHEFDHGGTRKLATQLVEADIYLYLTQDAYPADSHAFSKLIHTLLSNSDIACAYGRQLPKSDATPLSAHARLFNYPVDSQIRYYLDRIRYGIETCFNSDSFAAYKRGPLNDIGNFPNHLITGEDVYVAGKLLRQGYAIAYVANACVHHSHNLSLKEEFHRYFSIGVFHGNEKWLTDSFSSTTDEGFRFVKSEWAFLMTQKKWGWIPRAIASTFVKYFAYQLGRHEKKIPYFIKKRIGINKSFWLNHEKVITA